MSQFTKYISCTCAETKGAVNNTPKLAKTNFLDSNCRYGEYCAYSHKNEEHQTSIKHLEEEVKILKTEIDKLFKKSEEMTDKLKIVQSDDKEIIEIKENITQLRNNMSKLMVKIETLEENISEVLKKKSKKQKESYFKCDQCEFLR